MGGDSGRDDGDLPRHHGRLQHGGVLDESRLHLAVTHVTSSLNTTLESLEDILKILDEKSGD